jgi:signal transduction histidine kinase
VWPYLETGLGHFLLLMLVIAPLLGALFGLLYHQELRAPEHMAVEVLRATFLKAYLSLLLVAGIVAWWLVLAHKSRQVAQEESNRQTHLLVREIESHRQTDEALQQAKLAAEQARHAAEQANHAKSRYISAISHELRTPLNSILGYAQLMGEDAAIPSHRKHAVHVIKRGGEHLLSLIEGTLDIARIESGKLTLNVKPMRFADFVHELAGLFELQAAAKGLAFRFEIEGVLPEVVRGDEKRVRQILINLLGNAIKFTASGHVVFRVRHAREMAVVEVEDTGPGLAPDELAQIFEPFARGNSAAHSAPGAGLGLTIAKMLTDLMGGELGANSTPGAGSVFRVRLFLPEVHAVVAPVAPQRPPRGGYEGRAAASWWWTTRRPIATCWWRCWSRSASSCAPPRAATTRWTCWPRACGRTRSSWTWPCPASMAGKPSAGCGAWRPCTPGWQWCRPMPSTRAWTTMPASRPRTSS